MKNDSYGSSIETTDRVNEFSCSNFCSGNHKSCCVKLTEASGNIEMDQREVNIPFVNEWTIILRK